MSEKIDDLFVSLNVDLSGLDSGLNDAVGKVQKAGESMAGAFNGATGGIEPLSASLGKLGESAIVAGEGAKQATQGYLDLRPAIAGTGQAAEAAIGPIEGMLASLQKVALQFLAFNTIKNAIEEAVSAFSHLERATLSLTALTGSAEKANQQLQTLRDLSISNALSFPTLIDAAQRMTAFGFAAAQIPRAMQAAADAAAATNKDFMQVSQSMDRMALSGMASGRMLATMGISVQDLAKQMNMVGAATLDIQHAFTALDESARLEVLMGSMQKFAGVAAQAATSISGLWQNLKTEITQVAVEIVAALDSTMKELMRSFGAEALPGLRNMADGFKDLAATIGPVLLPVLKEAVETFGSLMSVIGGLEKVISTVLSPLDFLADKLKAGGVATENLHGGFLNISTMGLAKVAQDIGVLASSLQNYDARALAAAASSKAFADETNRLKSYIDGLHTPFQGMMADWHAGQVAIESARIKLQEATKAFNEHKVGIGAVNQAQQGLTQALQAADPALKSAAAAAKSAASFNENFARALQGVTDKIKDYEAGTGSLGSAVSAVNAIMERARLVWDKLSEAEKNAVIAMIPAANMLNELAKSQAFDALMSKVDELSIKYPVAFAKLDASTLALIDSWKTLNLTVEEMKALGPYLKALQEVLSSQTALDASNKQLFKTLEDGHTAVIKFGDVMAKAFEGGNQSASQLNEKIKVLGVQMGDAGQLILSAIKEINDLGFETQTQMDHQIAAMQRTLDLAIAIHQPLNTILGIQERILNAQLNENIAIGASSDETLKLAQALTAVSLAQFALHQQTAGDAELWKQVTDDMVKAFDSLGQSMAAAWFNGEVGAKALMDTLKKLAQQIVGDLVQGALKDLAASIIKNSGLMEGLGMTAAKTVQASTAAITSATNTASNSITQISKQALSSIFSLVSVVSAVISAITGIIGNIEMAHMEKTLGQIETNTRQIFNAVGGGSQSIAGTSLLSSQYLGDIRSTLQGAVVTLLVGISSNLDSIAADIHAGVFGSGGGTGDGNANAKLAATVRDLQNTVAQLTQDVMGPYGFGASVQGLGGATSNLASTSSNLSFATYDLAAATDNLASASTDAAGSLVAATKSLDQVAVLTMAAVASAAPGVKSLVSGGALGSQLTSTLATAPDIPGSRGMLGAIGALSVSDSGGYSKVQSTPGGWQKNEFTFNATPSVAELGHQFMDFLRGQGITL